jgi:uncharacterized membrane protein HdeD (DUF308 family)
MSTSIERPAAADLPQAFAALRGNWLWFVVMGAALVVLGCVALGAPWIATLATAMAIGALLAAAGTVETVGAFWSRRWSGFFVQLLAGVLSLVVGLVFMWAPADAALALTLPLACLLILGGLFKVVAALNYRFATWGWPLLSGVIDLILGVLMLLGWPASAFWVIGLFVGINLVFRGFIWIGLGVALGMLPPARAN